MTRKIRICLPCPRPRMGAAWGDWFFGMSLAAALERQGLETSFAFTEGKKWKHRLRPSGRWLGLSEIDLVVRGGQRFNKIPGRPLFIWLISQSDTFTSSELAEAEHVFVASKTYAEELAAEGHGVSYLPQCTDRSIFFPARMKADLATELLFVGNRRSWFKRPVVEMALATPHELSVWGRGWDDDLPAGVQRGSFIANSDLVHHYASANVVLNDHTPAMLHNEFLSNRSYDVLASGRPVLTEEMAGIPEDLRDGLWLYRSDTFADVVENALAVGHPRGADLSAHVRREHSFDARALQIVKVLGPRLR